MTQEMVVMGYNYRSYGHAGYGHGHDGFGKEVIMPSSV